MSERRVIREALLSPPDERQRQRMVAAVSARIRETPQDGRAPRPDLAAPVLGRPGFRPLLLATVGLILLLGSGLLLWGAQAAGAAWSSVFPSGGGCGHAAAQNAPAPPLSSPPAAPQVRR